MAILGVSELRNPLITFMPYTRKSQFVSDFNEIAAGTDCLHDYCGSSDTFHFALQPQWLSIVDKKYSVT